MYNRLVLAGTVGIVHDDPNRYHLLDHHRLADQLHKRFEDLLEHFQVVVTF